MFGAGWTEMIIIGVVALIVIGPKDLPIVMRKLGRVVGTVRRMGDEFQRELNKTTGLDQIADLKRSLTEPLRQTSEQIAAEFNKVTSTGVEPSGLITPTDPKVESVYDQIAATSGLPPASAANAAASESSATVTPAPPVMKPLAAAEPSPAPAEVSPAPPEAAVPPVTAPAKPKRAPRPKTESTAEAPKRGRKPAVAKSEIAEAGAAAPEVTKARAPRKVSVRAAAAVAADTEASVSAKPAAVPAEPAAVPAATTGEAIVPSPEKA